MENQNNEAGLTTMPVTPTNNQVNAILKEKDDSYSDETVVIDDIMNGEKEDYFIYSPNNHNYFIQEKRQRTTSPLPHPLFIETSNLPTIPPLVYNNGANILRPPSGNDPRVPDELHRAENEGDELRCQWCRLPPKNCHEVVFGTFCCHEVITCFEENGLETSAGELHNAYEDAYLTSLRFLTFDRTRWYDTSRKYDIPHCMTKGSYNFAMETVGWKKRVDYTECRRIPLACLRAQEDGCFETDI